jgi:ribosomal protein S18 acetylase RimI-like enzyme
MSDFFRRNRAPRWKRLGRRHLKDAEALLRQREPYCVSAAGRFRDLARFSDHLWGLRDPQGSMNALVLHSKRSLFPLLGNSITTEIKVPGFLGRFLRKNHIHAIQGLHDEVAALERIMTGLGREAADLIDYDLMSLDRPPPANNLGAGPTGLLIRQPESGELEKILPLQEAYEQEEVLPQGATFNADVCRLNLERILSGERILVAEIGGRVIAKANTSAVAFTRVQIGGVFVHPDYRGQGIARRLCAELARNLVSSGWGLSLFVKKNNRSAQYVYRSTGFRPIADYRIAYY